MVLEDLNVAGMGRTKTGLGARGRGCSRAIADAAFGELARQIGYKADWYGTELVVADRWFASSKTCSSCGARKPRLHLDERTHHCTQPDCGLVIDRDLNAAINLARWPQAGVPSPGSGPVEANYGRRADRETDPAPAGDAGGNDPSTPHRSGRVRRGPPPGNGRLHDERDKRSLNMQRLYAELQETNVGVSLVLPGAVRTDITANSGVEAPGSASAEDAKFPATEPDDAARIIVDGIEADRFHVYVGRDSRLMNLLNRLAPRRSTHLIQRQMKELLTIPE